MSIINSLSLINQNREILPKKTGIILEKFWSVGPHLEGLSLPFTTHPIKLKVDLLWPLLLEFSNIQIIWG